MISLWFTVCLWTNCGVHFSTSLYLGRPPGNPLSNLYSHQIYANELPGLPGATCQFIQNHHLPNANRGNTQTGGCPPGDLQTSVHGAVCAFAMALDACSECFQSVLGCDILRLIPNILALALDSWENILMLQSATGQSDPPSMVSHPDDYYVQNHLSRTAKEPPEAMGPVAVNPFGSRPMQLR